MCYSQNVVFNGLFNKNKLKYYYKILSTFILLHDTLGMYSLKANKISLPFSYQSAEQYAVLHLVHPSAFVQDAKVT